MKISKGHSKFSKRETFAPGTRQEIYLKFDCKCGQCGSKFGLQIHHLVHNTITNRKIYGDERVQSGENGYLCCQGCHDKYSLWDRELVSNLKNKWEDELLKEKQYANS